MSMDFMDNTARVLAVLLNVAVAAGVLLAILGVSVGI
jgi:hypothetical protein